MLTSLLIFIIRLYKKSISYLFQGSCRYYPSCSEYSVQALSKLGFIKGVFYSFWRILRCNPFSPGGYDPVVKTEVRRQTSENRGQRSDVRKQRSEARRQRTEGLLLSEF